MAKLVINNVTSGFYSTTALNDAFTAIETAIENTVSRDGTTPNQMTASLDMNSQRIVNLPEPLTNSEAARLVDVQNSLAGGAANLISSTPYGNISASNVQAAIQEEVDDLAASSGSSLIGFTQNGTGAVARTAQDELRERVDVSQFGAIGTGDETAKIQAAINALVSGQTLLVNKQYTVTGLTITNKTNIRITGKGGFTLSGAASGAKIFDLVGIIDNLQIDGLNLVGEGNVTYTQHAIGNASGQTISNVRFIFNKIESINVGISLNANLSGSYEKAVVYGNYLKNIVGTGVGSGYGIHLAKATGCVVANNIIDTAHRHSIYHAAGVDCGNVIKGNIIKNHRSGVATNSLLAALYVARSSGVLVDGNTLDGCYDGGINIAHATADSANCSHVDVINNQLRNRKNVLGHLYVGEQLTPGTYETTNIRIRENSFFTDAAAAAGNDVRFFNGRHIEFSGNTLHKINCEAGLHIFLQYGDANYISENADFTDNIACGNTFIAEGTLTDTRAISIALDVSTNTSSHRLDNRNHIGITTPTHHSAVAANPNLMVITENRCHVIGTGAGIAAGTTAGKVKSTAAIRFAYRRSTSSKLATDDLWDLTGVSTGVGEYRKVLLIIDSGAGAGIVVGDVASSASTANLPRLPDYDYAAVGVVEIPPSYAGGSVAGFAMYDITGIYEQ